MKPKNPKVVWLVRDCKWSTFRGVYLTRKGAMEDKPCRDCKIIRLEV